MFSFFYTAKLADRSIDRNEKYLNMQSLSSNYGGKKRAASFLNELSDAIRSPIVSFIQNLLDEVNNCLVKFVDRDMLEMLNIVVTKFICMEGSSKLAHKYQDELRTLMKRFFNAGSEKAEDLLKRCLSSHMKDGGRGIGGDRDSIFERMFLDFFERNMKYVLKELSGNSSRDKIVKEFTKEENLKERMLYGSLESTLEQLRKLYSRQLKTLRKFIAPQGAIFKHSPISLIKVFYSFCSELCSSSRYS